MLKKIDVGFKMHFLKVCLMQLLQVMCNSAGLENFGNDSEVLYLHVNITK